MVQVVGPALRIALVQGNGGGIVTRKKVGGIKTESMLISFVFFGVAYCV